MQERDAHGPETMSERAVHERQEEVDRRQHAVDDGRQQHESHGDADQRVRHAEQLALRRQRRLVAVAYNKQRESLTVRVELSFMLGA